MRILALDYGAARIGCAISDPSGTLATPLSSLTAGDPESVARLATEQRAERIVIGLPVSLDGSERGQAEETRRFGERLADLIDLPVEYYDERFTTRMASRTRRETGATSDEDSIAAAHLLDGYLTALGSRGEGP
jgi:putative Holliday junction resolvase